MIIGDVLKLRTATPNDVTAIRALVRDAYAKWVPLLGREPLPMATDYDEAVKNHRIDLLHLDGRLAALIEMIPANNHLKIENVAVAPAFQGRGIGQKLLSHAEQITLSLGHSEIRLSTNKLFAVNILLYEKLGYRIFREEPFKGGVAVHMSKWLNAELQTLPVRNVTPAPPSASKK